MPIPHSQLQYRLVRLLALVSAALLLAAVGVVMASGGVGQESFEHVGGAVQYTALLGRHAASVRLVIGIDTLFIFTYGVMFLALLDALRAEDAPHLRAGVFASLLALVLLDLYENHQIVTMIETVEQGLVVTQAEISHRTTWSQLKWHCAFFGLFGLGFLIEPDSRWARILRLSLWSYLPVIGALTYVWAGGRKVTEPMLYLGMLAGFVLLALLANRRCRDPRIST